MRWSHLGNKYLTKVSNDDFKHECIIAITVSLITAVANFNHFIVPSEHWVTSWAYSCCIADTKLLIIVNSSVSCYRGYTLTLTVCGTPRLDTCWMVQVTHTSCVCSCNYMEVTWYKFLCICVSIISVVAMSSYVHLGQNILIYYFCIRTLFAVARGVFECLYIACMVVR